MTISDEPPMQVVQVELCEVGEPELSGEAADRGGEDRAEQDCAVSDAFREVIEHGREAFVFLWILVEFPRLHALGVAIAMDDMAADRLERCGDIEFIHGRAVIGGGCDE